MHNQALENLFALGGTIVLIGIGIFILWLIALIDVIITDFKNPSNKTMWIILLIFLPPLGAILYMIIGVQQRTGTNKPATIN